MEESSIDVIESLRRLTGELQNFEEIVKHIKPPSGEIPELEGIEIYGETIPLEGLIGGDHIIYVDFKRRYDLEIQHIDNLSVELMGIKPTTVINVMYRSNNCCTGNQIWEHKDDLIENIILVPDINFILLGDGNDDLQKH